MRTSPSSSSMVLATPWARMTLSLNKKTCGVMYVENCLEISKWACRTSLAEAGRLR